MTLKKIAPRRGAEAVSAHSGASPAIVKREPRRSAIGEALALLTARFLKVRSSFRLSNGTRRL
jgi:hypothetical protein